MQYRSVDPDFDERLRRVMGQKAEPSHVERRVFVGGMPFYYDVGPIAHCEYMQKSCCATHCLKADVYIGHSDPTTERCLWEPLYV